MLKEDSASTKRQVHSPKKESTRSITYRLPEKLVSELETEATQKSISQNVLVKQILEKYVQWDRFSNKIGMIPEFVLRHSTFVIQSDRTGVLFSSVVVHQFTDTTDVDINRAGANAAAATNALNARIVFVHIIFQLVHETLTYPVQFGPPGIMPAAMHGKQRKHAAVPVAHPHPRFPLIFILDIKAPAGGT